MRKESEVVEGGGDAGKGMMRSLNGGGEEFESREGKGKEREAATKKIMADLPC